MILNRANILHAAKRSPEVCEILKDLFPDAFEAVEFAAIDEGHYEVDYEINGAKIIISRCSFGEHSSKALVLDESTVTWELKRDDGKLLLIPKRKI